MKRDRCRRLNRITQYEIRFGAWVPRLVLIAAVLWGWYRVAALCNSASACGDLYREPPMVME